MTSVNLAWVDVTSTGLTTATTNYSNGDILGAEGFIILPSSITDGLLMAAEWLDEADIVTSLDLYFGEAAFSLGSDNAAPSITDANARLIRPGVLSMPAMYDLGGCRVSSVDSLGLPLHAAVGATGIAFRAVATSIAASFFGAVGDLKFKFGFSKDV